MTRHTVTDTCDITKSHVMHSCAVILYDTDIQHIDYSFFLHVTLFDSAVSDRKIYAGKLDTMYKQINEWHRFPV